MVIISSKKENEIIISKFSVSGSISSISKNNSKKLLTKPLYEYINIIEFDKKIKSYCTRLFLLEYYNLDSLMYIEPDFFIEYKDKSLELVFINENVVENLTDLEINIAKEFCLNNNMKLKIINENRLMSSVNLYNANFLLDFKKPKYGFNLSDTDIIYNILGQYNVLTIEQLLNISIKSEEKRAELLYVVWVMIANYWIEFDNKEKVSLKTKVWNHDYNL